MTTPRPRLSRSRVLAAAVALADREGAQALTVRRLADDLDVHPTSLYNHLPNKAAILDGVVEQLFLEVPVPAGTASWRDWVRVFTTSMRDLARAHPGAFMVLTRVQAETPAALVLTERGLDAFAAGGFPPVQALRAVRTVSLAVLGLALNECQLPGHQPGQAHDGYAAHPRLAEAAALLDDVDDGHWDLLVEALVEGFARLSGTGRGAG